MRTLLRGGALLTSLPVADFFTSPPPPPPRPPVPLHLRIHHGNDDTRGFPRPPLSTLRVAVSLCQGRALLWGLTCQVPFLLFNGAIVHPRIRCLPLDLVVSQLKDISGLSQGSLQYTPEHCLANGGFPVFWWKKPCFKWAKCIF